MAERTTTLDSTGTASRIPPPPAVITTERFPAEPTRTASAEPVAPSAASPQPTASSQSVIVNEDAIYAAPAARSFSGQAYLASTVYFGHGSANLTGGERQEIARVAQAALANGAGVQVVGHASSRTADLSLRDHEVANLAISLRRAEVVADALIAAGMPANRVLVEAVSNTRPEFFEVMPAGEAGNRRTEIFLIY
jgi:outer membrane protein OmpA-like peptidoglycan-associated protein